MYADRRICKAYAAGIFENVSGAGITYHTPASILYPLPQTTVT